MAVCELDSIADVICVASTRLAGVDVILTGAYIAPGAPPVSLLQHMPHARPVHSPVHTCATPPHPAQAAQLTARAQAWGRE